MLSAIKFLLNYPQFLQRFQIYSFFTIYYVFDSRFMYRLGRGMNKKG